MNPAEFEEELQTARNPRKPSAYLLVLWVALADGERDPRQFEAAGSTIGLERVDRYVGLAEEQSYQALQLACGIIAESPPPSQLAVLIGGIRVAVANEELAVEENILLRFLGELTGQDLDDLFEEETGIGIPELQGGLELLTALEDSPYRESVLGLLTLIGRLRQDLSLPVQGWWDETLATNFAPVEASDTKEEEVPPPADRRSGGRLMFVAGAGMVVVVLAAAVLIERGKEKVKFRAAKGVGTIAAYEKFLQRYPRSRLGEEARGEITRLHYEKAGRSRAASTGLRRPDPDPVKPPGVPAKEPVDYRDDPDWLVQSGTRADCQDYLKRNPESPAYDEVNDHLINLEIAMIGKEAHQPIGELVQVDPGDGGEVSIVELRNGAASPLTFLYRGDKCYRLVVPQGQTKALVIQNGIYTVAVTGEGAEQENRFLGRHELIGGRYSYAVGSGEGAGEPEQ